MYVLNNIPDHFIVIHISELSFDILKYTKRSIPYLSIRHTPLKVTLIHFISHSYFHQALDGVPLSPLM